MDKRGEEIEKEKLIVYVLEENLFGMQMCDVVGKDDSDFSVLL